MIVRAALAALAALGATACKRGAPARHDAAPVPPPDAAAPWVAPGVVIDRVEVTLGSIPDTTLVSRELGRQLARCLIEAGDDVFALDRQVPPARRPLGAALALAFDAAPTPGGDALVVQVTAAMRWRDDLDLPAPRVELAAQGPILDGRRDVATIAVVDTLQQAVCRQLAAQIDLLVADDVASGLTSDDEATVAWTLAVIAARRPPGVAAGVVPLVDRPPPIGDAALAALVALADPAVVPALTARVDLADRERLTATVEAVIAIGGPDAEAFLQVLASHRDPAIAAHARDGLDRLRRRAAP